MAPDKPELQEKEDPSIIAISNWYQQLNDTFTFFPSHKTVDDLISGIAHDYPDLIAVEFEDQKLTYQQLENKASQFANHLLRQGILKGDIVGLALNRSINLPIVILGILKIGCTFQPIDADYPKQRTNYILQDGNAKLLVISDAHKNNFATTIKTVFIEDIDLILHSYPTKLPKIERNSAEIIYILHTSGSTGTPKGVLINHRNVVNLLWSMKDQPGLKTGDRLLSITSISFDIFYLELFLPLMTGATVVFINSEDLKDARAIVNCIQQKNISTLQSTPSMWSNIIELAGVALLPIKGICGGEALPKELAVKILGKVNELWNVYGPTETTIWASVKKISVDDEIISIGRPIYNTGFYILDEKKQLMPPGEIGEIFIAGENVGQGYLHLPELTAERFLPDMLAGLPNRKMYQTGDLGKILTNGDVQCLGRIDEQIKINGFRIEPGEIENVIKTAVNGIKQVIVTPTITKTNAKLLVAYYILDDGKEGLDNATWKQLLKQYLPDYMVPNFYVVLDSFPMTPNGKIDKKKFKLPEGLNPSIINKLQLTVNEQVVMSIWSKLLANDNLGLNDDFFDIGGYSLIAALMMNEIEEQTDAKLPMAILFENSTIKTLAAAIDNAVQHKYGSLVAINPKGLKPPLFVVHGSGLNILMFYPLLKYLDKDQPVYGLQALGLDGSTIKGDTIEALASLYIQEMLQAMPKEESFAIIGYSLGGIIAVEMAKQLKMVGKKIKLLGAIDTYIDNEGFHKSAASRIIAKIIRQPKKLAFIIKSIFQQPKESIQYQYYVTRLKAKNFYKNVVNANNNGLSLEANINQHYEAACKKYKLKPCDEKFYLFKVAKRVYYIDDPHFLGWKPYTPKGLEITDVPGDHKTFMEAPNDKVFAETLQEILNRVNAE